MGEASVWMFTVFAILLAFLEATVRPYTTNLMLGLASSDIGSASSLINCLHAAFGTLGMGLIMLPFSNFIVGLGFLMLGSMIVGLVLWHGACKASA